MKSHFVSSIFFLFGTFLQICNGQNLPPLGGELSYEYIGDSSGISHHYAVELILYKTLDTSNRQALTGLVTSSCFTGQTLNLKPIFPNNTSMTNGGLGVDALINCGDTLNSDSVQRYSYHYGDTLVLPGACADYNFIYSECCRDPLISNINQPGSTPIYISASLNNVFGSNTSPTFISQPRYLFCKNQPAHIFLAAGEPDSDSLKFRLKSARDQLGNSVSYSSGFTLNQPLDTFYSINPDFILNPRQAGNFTVVYEIEEYRYDLLQGWLSVGKTMREINYTVRDTCPDYLLNSYGGGLIPEDTLYGIGCYDTLISFGTNLFRGDMLTSYGAEFRILGPDTLLRPVISASTFTNPGLLSDSIWLELHVPPSQNGSFLLYYKGGNLFNDCRNEFTPDYAYFIITDCNITGLKEELRSNGLSVYPNPTRGKLTVETNGEDRAESITLFDLQGRELKLVVPDGSNTEIDVSALLPGMYLLKVETEKGQITRLIQKQ